MALKAILETLDGVDDAVKAMYVEKDGKHVLQVEGIDLHPDVAGLKSAYEKVKTGNAADKTELANLKAQVAEMAKNKPDEAAILAARKAIEDERDGWKSKAEEAFGRLTGVTRDRALDEALTSAGVSNAAFRKAATSMLSGAIKIDGDKVHFETDMGPMAVGDYVKRWAAGDGKDFVTPASGGGAQGGKGGVKPAGNLSGSVEERRAALKTRFPDLE